MFLHDYSISVGEAIRAIPVSYEHALVRCVQSTRESGHTVFTCGNGGSASAASHLAQDLAKGTLIEGQPRLRAICLCDSIPNVTAWANDEGYEHIFAEQLRTLGRARDMLIAISGSGNSPNVLRAVETAHDLEMHTWGITGFDGGKLLSLAHRCIRVPRDDMGQVEAAHGVLFHWLIDALEQGRAPIVDTRSAVER